MPVRLDPMHNNGKPWTEVEDEYLRQHYASQPASKTAAELGRTVRSVRVRALQLGIKLGNARRGGREWRRYPKAKE